MSFTSIKRDAMVLYIAYGPLTYINLTVVRIKLHKDRWQTANRLSLWSIIVT